MFIIVFQLININRFSSHDRITFIKLLCLSSVDQSNVIVDNSTSIRIVQALWKVVCRIIIINVLSFLSKREVVRKSKKLCVPEGSLTHLCDWFYCVCLTETTGIFEIMHVHLFAQFKGMESPVKRQRTSVEPHPDF